VLALSFSVSSGQEGMTLLRTLRNLKQAHGQSPVRYREVL